MLPLSPCRADDPSRMTPTRTCVSYDIYRQLPSQIPTYQTSSRMGSLCRHPYRCTRTALMYTRIRSRPARFAISYSGSYICDGYLGRLRGKCISPMIFFTTPRSFSNQWWRCTRARPALLWAPTCRGRLTSRFPSGVGVSWRPREWGRAGNM